LDPTQKRHGLPPQNFEEAKKRAEYASGRETEERRRFMSAIPQGTKVGKHAHGVVGWLVGLVTGVGIGLLLLESAPVSLPVGATLGLTELLAGEGEVVSVVAGAAGEAASTVAVVSSSAYAGGKAGSYFDEQREERLQKSQERYTRFAEESKEFLSENTSSGSLELGGSCGEIRNVGLTLHIEDAPATHVGIPIEGCSECEEMKTGRAHVLFGEDHLPLSTNGSITHHEAKPLHETTVLVGGEEATSGADPFENLMERTKTTEEVSAAATAVFGGAHAMHEIYHEGFDMAVKLAGGALAYQSAVHAISAVGNSIDHGGPVSELLDEEAENLAKMKMKGFKAKFLELPPNTCSTCNGSSANKQDDKPWAMGTGAKLQAQNQQPDDSTGFSPMP
jgi:hypothetical protein